MKLDTICQIMEKSVETKAFSAYLLRVAGMEQAAP
jgi:hypothetical protein